MDSEDLNKQLGLVFPAPSGSNKKGGEKEKQRLEEKQRRREEKQRREKREKEQEKAKQIVEKVVKYIEVGAVILAILGIAALCMCAIWDISNLVLATGIIFLIIPIIFCIVVIKIVKRPAIWVIRALGSHYAVWREGIHIRIPFLMERVKPGMTEEIFEIAIFQKEILGGSDLEINFRGGGTAILKQAKAWAKITDAETAAYNIEDYIKATREAIEDAVRTTLNNTQIESIVGSLTQPPKKTHIDENFEEFRKSVEASFNSELRDIVEKILETTLEDDYGVKLAGRKLTITDYEWSKEVLEAMRAVFQQRQQKIISEHEADARNTKITVLNRIAKALEDEGGWSKEDSRRDALKMLQVEIASGKDKFELKEYIGLVTSGGGSGGSDLSPAGVTRIGEILGPIIRQAMGGNAVKSDKTTGETDDEKKSRKERDWDGHDVC